jgi:dihydrofolate reductase
VFERDLRKLVVLTFLTLDGVMQAPGGPEEDTTGVFKWGGWSAGYWDDTLGKVMGDQMGHPYDLLLGRKTYEIFAAHWPRSTDPGAEGLNNARKYVASKTLKKLEWKNSTLLGPDIVTEIKNLKRQDGPEIQVHGSSNLIQTLLKNDLVDKFKLKIFPVTVGKGKRLFGEGAIPAGYKLVQSQTTPTGVIVATYTPAGEPKTGSFALEQPARAEQGHRTKLAKEN